MRTKLIIIAALLLLGANAYGQTANPWTKWYWMIGEWQGSGTETPGTGGGTFTFMPDLDNNVLIRRSHSEYPAAKGKADITHDDLMIIYLDAGEPSRAIYFDNEGHTINYSITYGADSIVLLGDRVPNSPVFRLTYVRIDAKTANVKFEMSPDGEKFMTYIEGRSTKVPSQTKPYKLIISSVSWLPGDARNMNF